MGKRDIAILKEETYDEEKRCALRFLKEKAF